MGTPADLMLTLFLTVIITTLIIRGANWIKENREKYPELYKQRGLIGAIIYLLLNSTP